MYHEVSADHDDAFRKYIVSPRAFRSQMRWLAAAGYTPVTLTSLLSFRAGTEAPPRKPVVITFDDTFTDCAHRAGEVLREYGFAAVFFVVSGLVGQPGRWLLAEHRKARAVAGWSDLRELRAAGFELGAHTVTHPRLTQLPPAAVRHELSSARSDLQQQLGGEVDHLAYPFGLVNDMVRRIAEDVGYRSACTTQIGISTGADDALLLPRVPVTGTDTLADFACRLRSAGTVRQTLRRALLVCRARIAPGGRTRDELDARR
jgi:peptidoglycan/xylan/chitin deacetylase (PgdA/CDA1 family)